jgi:hypothetical protein
LPKTVAKNLLTSSYITRPKQFILLNILFVISKMILFEEVYNPEDFDILLMDIKNKDIHKDIPNELQVEYLSASSEESNGDIYGIIYGGQHRLFCATTVKYKNNIKVVIFLVDTGSEMTFLSEEVLDKFGINSERPFQVQINSRRVTVMRSHSHFKDISVRGMGFLTLYAYLYLCSCNSNFVLKFSQNCPVFKI